jgi:regulator of sigma E protease
MLIAYAIVTILFFFGLTIFVHELGHFLTARRCGMVIDVFSIGFGPALWKRRVGGVLYKIGIVPFGGYVALPQMDPTDDEIRDGKTGTVRDLPFVSPWKRAAVAVAGAAGNVALAFALAVLVWLIGKPSSPAERRCVIGYVDPEAPAHAAGLRVGDRVVAANGKPVGNWTDFITALALDGGREARVDVRREGEPEPLALTVGVERTFLGIYLPPGVLMEELCRVAVAEPGGSAAAAGVEPGDIIQSFNGDPVYSTTHLVSLVSAQADRDVPMTVKRGTPHEGYRTVAVIVRPRLDPALGRARIGIRFSDRHTAIEFDQFSHPRPFAQLRDHAQPIFRFLKALTTRKQFRAAAGSVGGPVFMLSQYWIIVRESIMMTIWFTCLINVNLAILNLLPLPVLDGGHIVFSLIEIVTRRRLNAVVVRTLQQVFAVLLIGLFLFLTYRDTARLVLPGLRRGPPPAATTNGVPTPVIDAAPAFDGAATNR